MKWQADLAFLKSLLAGYCADIKKKQLFHSKSEVDAWQNNNQN